MRYFKWKTRWVPIYKKIQLQFLHQMKCLLVVLYFFCTLFFCVYYFIFYLPQTKTCGSIFFFILFFISKTNKNFCFFQLFLFFIISTRRRRVAVFFLSSFISKLFFLNFILFWSPPDCDVRQKFALVAPGCVDQKLSLLGSPHDLRHEVSCCRDINAE